jgi:hypothetical protein
MSFFLKTLGFTFGLRCAPRGHDNLWCLEQHTTLADRDGYLARGRPLDKAETLSVADSAFA